MDAQADTIRFLTTLPYSVSGGETGTASEQGHYVALRRGGDRGHQTYFHSVVGTTGRPGAGAPRA
jgi:hypothetical protein